MRRVAILGTGLIGASLGMALRELDWVVAGWDPSSDALETAHRRGAVDVQCESIADAISGVDLVVLASPLGAALETLAVLETDALVTDVAGVKVPMVEARPDGMRFVGSHPMAGREHAGPSAATPALFRGAAWIVCPDGADESDLETVCRIVESVGAVPTVMAAADHDRAVAKVSHLPQVVATSLVNQVSDDAAAAQLISGSFRDLTRVASSEPGWWPEILMANDKSVSAAIDELIGHLTEMRDTLGVDEDRITERLAEARDRRRAMAPQAVRVGVVLQDKPGEIAAVGRALEESGVDVRDLQLRHALHGGGGVLTLSVRPGEAEPLKGALVSEGFTLE